ncbi:MAG TPA: alpha/beta hydrolase [Gemmatimonadales bacterium]|nr:alpha/beta hydrolase [Gemmatimonadales bacterium]
MNTTPTTFVHRFVPGIRPGAVPVLLLHGTGGNEEDLLPLGRAMAPGAPLLSPRGQVLENGMPRFFRRLSEGVFDEADIRARAQDLVGFVAEMTERHSLGPIPPIALGFSNGANMAVAMLLLHPGSLSGALLLRPMVPLVPEEMPRLDEVRVLIAAGRQDPIVRPEQSQALADLLAGAGADVTLRWINAGHALTREDLEAGERWMTATGATT